MSKKSHVKKDCEMLELASRAAEKVYDLLAENQDQSVKALWWGEARLKEDMVTILHNVNNVWARRLTEIKEEEK